ncbi:MAG TPA: ATP-binding protein, partial [Leptospiraceae bacterium]|nr:ATP-binding protein [Leptospiraceae bacterium]
MHETSERIFQSLAERSKNFFELFRKKTLISFSGGKDSRLLLELYRLLHRNGITPEPVIFHLNHRIRDNSEQEKEILEFIKNTGYPFIYREEKIPAVASEKKMSLEEAGRFVRQDLLKKAAEKENLIIALG